MAFAECQHSMRITERSVRIQEDIVDHLSRAHWIHAVEGAHLHHHHQTTDAGGRHRQGHRHQVQVVEQHLSKMEAGIVGVHARKVDIVPVTVDKEMRAAEEVGEETLQSVEMGSSTTMEGTIVLRSRAAVVGLHLHLHLHQVQVAVG